MTQADHTESEHRLEEAAKQLRLHAEETGDEEARDLARLVEIGEYPAAEEVAKLRRIQAEVHEWRQETVPNAEPLDQAAHTAGEAQELLDLYVKAKQYEGHPDTPESGRIADEAGDVFVSHLSFCAMVGLDPLDAIEHAFAKVNGEEWKGDRGL